ncbi:MAG: cofactor-independent phosphoglycerate mutase [Phycisphaerae bacterium]|jgi:2,3-bisphosphoglycerate-independent phosphoglycerate mutase|nr:cofactor-independent phosphoglycerate mutase [Phycisphaerae bacterium]
MKYAIIIPDGAADEPLDELEGKTPLAAAEVPNMDWVACHGRCGTVRNIPKGLPCGSDVAILSLLGYNPKKYYTGRAPLEAVTQGLKIGTDECVFRCNLVTLADGKMEDYSAGHIRNEESHRLIDALNEELAGEDQHRGIRFYPGVGYRHLMTFAGDCRVRTTAPHDVLDQEVAAYLPRGRGSKLLRSLMERGGDILAAHEINIVRAELGENPANAIWLWGQGKMPSLPTFAERFAVQGAAITAVDLVRGLAKLIGWDLLSVDGATGYLDTNYAGKGTAAVGALDKYDLVFVHVEATDEAGHNADAAAKVQALEQIDRHIVGPVLKRLRDEGDQWRIMVLPDHPTPCTIRTHTPEPVPFAIAGKDMQGVPEDELFTEEAAAAADLHIARGCDLMEFFLTVR